MYTESRRHVYKTAPLYMFPALQAAKQGPRHAAQRAVRKKKEKKYMEMCHLSQHKKI